MITVVIIIIIHYALLTSFSEETQSSMEGGVNGYKSFAKSLLQSSHNSELVSSPSEGTYEQHLIDHKAHAVTLQ